jgi:glycine cleavage system H protein
MEFYHYDIFETKGLEYIVTIVFFALLVPLWLILRHHEAINKGIRNTLSVLNPQRFKIPKGIFHSPNHTWAYLNQSGNARIGLDEFLLHITGPVSVTPLVREGLKVKRGDLIARIVQGAKQLNVQSPITGTVKLTNYQHAEDPSTLIQDPYGDGWLFEIKPSNWVAETKSYYIADEVINWSITELSRLKDFFAAIRIRGSVVPPAVVLQDGGELREHLLTELEEFIWEEFQNGFMKMPTTMENE